MHLGEDDFTETSSTKAERDSESTKWRKTLPFSESVHVGHCHQRDFGEWVYSNKKNEQFSSLAFFGEQTCVCVWMWQLQKLRKEESLGNAMPCLPGCANCDNYGGRNAFPFTLLATRQTTRGSTRVEKIVGNLWWKVLDWKSHICWSIIYVQRRKVIWIWFEYDLPFHRVVRNKKKVFRIFPFPKKTRRQRQ